MFTIVVDEYNFGQNNWDFQYKPFQKKIKKIFKGYDYIANVALDEFPRISFHFDDTAYSRNIFSDIDTMGEIKIIKTNKKILSSKSYQTFRCQTTV